MRFPIFILAFLPVAFFASILVVSLKLSSFEEVFLK